MSRDKDDAEESGSPDEKRERTIAFILEQQAQFAAGVEQLREPQARSEERWKRAEDKWDRMWERTNGQINALLSVAEIQSQELDTLARPQSAHEQSLAQLMQSHAQVAQTLAQIAESQANTDKRMAETNERLNALINVVERVIIERRNGG